MTPNFANGPRPSLRWFLDSLNTHGLDDEGWGPIRSSYLQRLLERLLALETVEILPAGRALAKYAS